MIDKGKHNILGVGVNVIDYEATVDHIITASQTRQPLTVSALAVHGVMIGVLDPEHCYRLNRLDLVVPDGQPVRWALNLLYQTRLSDRVYGPTLMLKICDRAARDSLPIYLYGSKPEILTALVKNLQARFPNLLITGFQPSRFRQISAAEKAEIAADIRNSGAAMVFVGLGCPRQEVWAYEYREQIGIPIIAVGAAFDFHAGLLAQAPPRLQKWGLEWFFRLIQEPRRLWRRYMLLNPLYISLLTMQILGLRQFSPKIVTLPLQEMRYG